MKNGSTSASAFASHLKTTSVETQACAGKMATTGMTANQLGNQLAIAGVKAKVAGLAMNLAFNAGIMLAITAITTVVSKFANAEKESIENAQKATETYKDETKSISDYKSKISELQKELSSNNISYKDAKEKREQLMSIQDELIKKYGKEEKSINAITQAINGQVDALDVLNEQEYREWYAGANKKSMFASASGLDRAKSAMEGKKSEAIMLMSNRFDGEIGDIQKKIDSEISKRFNISSKQLYNNQAPIGMKSNDLFSFDVQADGAENMLEKLKEIRQAYIDISKEEFVKNNVPSDKWEEYRKNAIDSIDAVIRKYDKSIEDYGETYKTYIQGKIMYDSEYSDQYADLLQKQSNLQEAETSGEQEKINKARKELLNSFDTILEDTKDDKSINNYVQGLYEQIAPEVAKWKFEINFSANVGGIADKAKELGNKYNAKELYDMAGTTEQLRSTAFSSVIQQAQEIGLIANSSKKEVQKLIDLLVQMGYVADGNNNNTPSNTKDIKTFEEVFSSATKTVQNNLQKMANAGTITPSIIENTKDYKTLIEETGLSAEEVTSKLYEMSKPSIRLEGVVTQIGSLSDAYSEMKEKGFNLATTTTKLDNVWKSLDGYNNFAKTIQDSTSSSKELQDAYNDLVSEYIQSTSILDTVTKQNKEQVVTQLKAVGVTNAEELATKALRGEIVTLNGAKAKLKELDLTLSEVNAKKLQQLVKEGKLTNEMANSIARYAAKKMLSNGLQLDETESVKQLLKLVGASKSAIAALDAVESAKKRSTYKNLNKSQKKEYDKTRAKDVGMPQSYWDYQAKKNVEKKRKKAEKKANAELNKQDIAEYNVDFSPNDTTNKKSSSNKKKNKSSSNADKTKTTYKKFKQTIDWCAESITNLTNKISLLQAKLENTVSIEKQISKTKELIKEQSNLATASGQSAKKYKNVYNNKLKKLGKKYGQEYVDKIVNGEFTIENFKGKTKTVTKNGKSKTTKSEQEKLWNLLQKTVKARDTYNEQEEHFQKQLKQLQTYSDELATIRWDKASKDVDKLANSTELLNKQLENTGELASKNSLVDATVSNQKNVLSIYENAYNKDLNEQNKLYSKLNKKNKGKIDKTTGLIDLNTVVGKNAKAVAKQRKIAAEYNAMVQKNQEDLVTLQKAQQDYITAYNEAFETKSSNITNDYSNRLSMLEYSANTLNDYIDLVEAKGQYVDNSFYDALAENSRQKQEEYTKEIQQLEELQSATTQYSQEWYDLEVKVQEALASQRAETKNQVDYINKQVDNIVNLHDAINEYMQDVIDESKFVRGLLDDVDLYDKDTGEMTDVGWTAVALGITEYEALQKQIEQTEKSLQELDEKFADDKYNAKYIEARRKLIKTYQDEVTASKEAKKGVSDLITNGYEKQLSALQKLINKKKEQLEVEKSEHDYQKTIAEKSKNISDLDKQRKMLNGDNSEDAMAKKQSLDKQLKDAREDLQETQYEKYIERQESYLDDLQENFSEIIEGLKQDIDGNFKAANETLTAMKKAEEEYYKNKISSETIDGIKNALTEDDSTLATKSQAVKDAIDSGLIDKDGKSKITNGVDKINNKFGTEQSNTRTTIASGNGSMIEKANSIFKSGSDNILNNIMKGTKDGDKTSVGFAESINKELGKVVDKGIKVTSDTTTKGVTNNPNTGYGGDKNGKGGLNDASNGGGNPGGATVTNVVPNIPTNISTPQKQQVDTSSQDRQAKQNAINSYLNNHGWNEDKSVQAYNNNFNNWRPFRRGFQSLVWSAGMSKKKMLSELGLAKIAYLWGTGNGKSLLSDTQKDEMDRKYAFVYQDVSGYSTGGFLDDVTSGGTGGAVAKVIKRNNDDGIATFKKGEAILSPAQTAMFREMLANMDTITTFQNMLKDNNKSYATNNTTTSATSIDNVNFEFNLPNVVDPQTLIKTVQTNSSVQKTLQEATIGQLNTTNRLGINRIR